MESSGCVRRREEESFLGRTKGGKEGRRFLHNTTFASRWLSLSHVLERENQLPLLPRVTLMREKMDFSNICGRKFLVCFLCEGCLSMCAFFQGHLFPSVRTHLAPITGIINCLWQVQREGEAPPLFPLDHTSQERQRQQQPEAAAATAAATALSRRPLFLPRRPRPTYPPGKQATKTAPPNLFSSSSPPHQRCRKVL